MERDDDRLPAVTLFTITYRQPDRIRLTVRDALAQHYPTDRLEIVVVDHGSGDGTAQLVRALTQDAPRAKLIEAEHEADYESARLWNAGLAAAAEQTAVFVQVDDVRLRPDFVREHVKWHLDDRLRLVTGPKVEGPGLEPVWDPATCKRQALSPRGRPVRCNFVAIWGASMSFGRELVELVRDPPFDNPYDERMTGWGWHEVELAYRMESAGAELVYDPAVAAYHPLHDARADRLRRSIDRTATLERTRAANERYVREKHALASLPWWDGPGEEVAAPRRHGTVTAS
jgi:glycosyltransferase involved in cell wall biosynthesis